ncbi:MAG: hypothetical protein M3Q69_10295 [Acidobacteriota bacterium]|nr:hypothetical protein [Acidobacteriota bacterium]
MKKFVPVFFLLLLVSLSSEAQSRMHWGVRAGVLDNDPMIGAEVIFPVWAGVSVNPNIEFASDVFTANADAVYTFPLRANTSFWAGAGLAFVNPDEGDYDGGFNILGGVGMQRGRWNPYAQLKLTSAGDIDDFVSVAAGVRF